jgi:hypothetical protein
MTLKIGDTIYRFDGNRRVYRPAPPGRFSSGPIYSEHFEPLKIIGENRVSWLLEKGWKAKKSDLSSARAFEYGGRGFFTAEGMEDDIWQHDHRHKIRDLFDRCSPAQLRLIASVLEYEPKPDR